MLAQNEKIENTVLDLLDIAERTELIRELSFISMYVLEDPQYSNERCAEDLVKIINRQMDLIYGREVRDFRS